MSQLREHPEPRRHCAQGGAQESRLWDGAADPELPRLRVTRAGERFGRASRRVCLSNSFAFGGSNACLAIGDAR